MADASQTIINDKMDSMCKFRSQKILEMDLSRELTREGVRGGREQFKWDSLKTKSLKEREHYLGSIAHVGVPGKFGQSSTNDWWRKGKDEVLSSSSICDEKSQVKEMENQLMMEALGIKPKRLMLARNKLSTDQVNDILKKEENPSSGAPEPHPKPSNPEEEEAPDTGDLMAVQGFGYRKYLKNSEWDHEDMKSDEVIELKGEGIQDEPRSLIHAIKEEQEESIHNTTGKIIGPMRPVVPVKEESSDPPERSSHRSTRDHEQTRNRSRSPEYSRYRDNRQDRRYRDRYYDSYRRISRSVSRDRRRRRSRSYSRSRRY